jgi:hypothetical protein
VFGAERRDLGPSHQLLKRKLPPMVSGAKRPYSFRDLGKTSMAQFPFRPKQECKRLYSTYTLTDEPWEQKLGGVALDYLGIIWWSSCAAMF